jgi:hypothetical protein
MEPHSHRSRIKRATATEQQHRIGNHHRSQEVQLHRHHQQQRPLPQFIP